MKLIFSIFIDKGIYVCAYTNMFLVAKHLLLYRIEKLEMIVMC